VGDNIIDILIAFDHLENAQDRIGINLVGKNCLSNEEK